MGLDTNLISYWKLDESSGNAADSVGSNTLTNNNTITYSAGKINNGALLALASSQYFSAADSASLSITGNISLSQWVKFTTVSGVNEVYQIIQTKGDLQSATNLSWILSVVQLAGTKYVQLQISNGTTVNNLNVAWAPSTATWYHIAVTWVASTSKANFYINGALQGTEQTGTITALNDNNIDFTIGAGYNGTASAPYRGSFLDGMIDEVGIWSRALSTGEVSQLYNSGTGLQYPFANPPIGFDAATDGSSTTGTSLTWAHTCTGTDRILWVHAALSSSATFIITGVTYNGVAFTKARAEQKAGPSNIWSSLWYLVAPATGANNVVISTSSSTDIRGTSSSYINAKQTGVVDSSNSSSGSGDPYTISTTTVANNTWLIGGFSTQRDQAAGANTTFRVNTAGYVLADSNASKSPAGSYSFITDQIPSGAEMAASIVSFAPATGSASATGNFFAFF